jgi:DNA mismatch repair protein MutS
VRFVSLLFADRPRPDEAHVDAPEHFTDLALDQVVAGATAHRDEHHLTPLWHLPLRDRELIGYRQAVFADLDRPPVRQALEAFAVASGEIGRQLGPNRRAASSWQARRWVLNAAARYCHAIAALADALPAAHPRSAALTELAAWLQRYVASDEFTTLRQDAARVLKLLSGIRYNILLRGLKVTVEAFDDEADLTEQVTATFEKFRQAPARDFHSQLPNPYLDPVTAQVSNLVAKLFPDQHTELAHFATDHADFLDPTIDLLARELQFFLGYHAYLTQIREAGLPVTLPRLGPRGELEATDTYDLALATSLIAEQKPVVTNDVALAGSERILVVSGPNQGGKTTLARTIGQLHYLTSLGCPVPGRHVSLAVPDSIFTHFERQEDLTTLAGKLEDDLIRIHRIVEAVTGDSVVILNEIFSSTTLEDARMLSIDILTRLADVDAICVCVTFIDELSRLNDKTVSMVATVDPHDPAIRTLKLVRRPADGRAYALALAGKYELTYDQLTRQANGGRGPDRSTPDRAPATAATAPPTPPHVSSVPHDATTS